MNRENYLLQKEYNKTYDDEEFKKRFSIFKQKVQTRDLVHHNIKVDSPLKKGINEFSDSVSVI